MHPVSTLQLLPVPRAMAAARTPDQAYFDNLPVMMAA